MDYCSSIESLRKQLIHAINNSGLTVGCACLVVKDVYNVLYLSFLEELEKEKKGQLGMREQSLEVPIQPQENNEEKENENDEQNND